MATLSLVLLRRPFSSRTSRFAPVRPGGVHDFVGAAGARGAAGCAHPMFAARCTASARHRRCTHRMPGCPALTAGGVGAGARTATVRSATGVPPRAAPDRRWLRRRIQCRAQPGRVGELLKVLHALRPEARRHRVNHASLHVSASWSPAPSPVPAASRACAPADSGHPWTGWSFSAGWGHPGNAGRRPGPARTGRGSRGRRRPRHCRTPAPPRQPAPPTPGPLRRRSPPLEHHADLPWPGSSLGCMSA